ncbi:alpha/beta fold hydrolase [Kitasatospora sp. NPDC052896]|uniref:alpha/beta fold hydrolase n=1 Tax=Kitasatospora sp. NPDC052896 TaxID=3364061 RepID=UPI0037CBF8ED
MAISTTIEQTAWTGMVSVDDTALAVTDTGGPGPAVVYLNGSYADQKPWHPVITDLGSDYRHIAYDERARGKSRTATDYTFEATIRDLDAVLTARGVQRPILVGWSYGAMIAIHWAARHPDRVAGVVSVDGALPTERLDDATREKVRKLFRNLSPIFPIARRLGLAARMSAAQHAEINLELIDLCAPDNLNPVLDRTTTPTRYVLGSGGNLGAEEKVIEKLRADLTTAIADNPHIQVSTKVASNHSKILHNDSRAVANAVRELTTTRDHQAA